MDELNSVQYATLFGFSLFIPIVGILITDSKIWAALLVLTLTAWAIIGVL
jgi:hypothetical protein